MTLSRNLSRKHPGKSPLARRTWHADESATDNVGTLVQLEPVQLVEQNGHQLQLSVVIPLFNERESLKPLHAALHKELELLGRSYEIIFVDDGSRDGSHKVLQELAAGDPAIRVIRLRRNFGQTAAFSAGFHAARGEIVVTMDADLQNDPADISLLLAKVDEGYDVVSGWRVKRQDAFITRRLPSIVANRVVSIVTGVHLHDYGCSLKAYRAEVVKGIHLYGEMHRFIPAIASQTGVDVAEIPVHHSARKYGKSKYGLGRISRVLLDLLTVKFLLSFSTRPIHVFGLLGLASFMSGTLMAMYLSVLKLFYNQPIGERPLLTLAVLLIILGVQFIAMGLLGEFLVRIYYEVQGKQTYSVRETFGHDD
jgi:glycosyltransferase involved in cell wall biosynthesis